MKYVTFDCKTITIPEEQMYWLDRLLSSKNIGYEQKIPAGMDVDVIFGSFNEWHGRVKQKDSDNKTGDMV